MAGPEMVWITAQPRNPATGAVATVRLAGGGRSAPYRHPVSGEQHRAGVVGRPRFKAALDFGDDGWTGRTVPTTGNLDFKPAQATLLDQLGGLYWKDAALLVEVGPEGGAVSTLLNGTVKNCAATLAGLLLEVADLSVALDKPLATAKFAGDGGIEGGEEAAGRVKRRSWGRVFNVEGRVLDKANNIYEFGDPAFKLQAISPLRDMGRSAAPEPSIVTWQGSAAATLTALKAATCAEGSGVVAPSIACAKWWTQPTGPLTADLLGEIGAGYVETAPEIAARISGAMTGPAITNTAAMALLRPDPAGIHIGDSSETAAAALDRLCLGVSLLWVLLPAGTIQLREQTFSAPVETLISHSVSRKKAIAPVGTRRVGWSRSHRIHSDAEISTAIDAAFVQPGPPAAWQSKPGVIWLDSDDDYRAHERVAGSGYLEDKNGNAVLDADGHEIEAAWVVAADQRLREAWDLANDALQALADIADDAVLSVDEKIKILVPQAAQLEGAWTILDAQAASLGVVTARTAAATERTDWLAMLAAITPAWNDTSQPSPVTRATYDAALLAYTDALEGLNAAIASEAAMTRTIGFGPKNVTLQYDYLGAAVTGQLGGTLTYKLLKNGTAQTSGVTWAYRVLDGTFNGFTLASGDQAVAGAGSLALPITSLGSDKATVELIATQDGREVREPIRFEKQFADPPSGGGAAVTLASKSSGFTSVTNTTFGDKTGTMTGTMPTGKTTAIVVVRVALNGQLASPSGTWNVEGKVLRETSPGTWTQIGSTANSDPDPAVELESGIYQSGGSGALEFSINDTGLTAGNTYNWRVEMRLTSGSKTIYVTGTVSITA